jgi:hypothetical protein
LCLSGSAGAWKQASASATIDAQCLGNSHQDNTSVPDDSTAAGATVGLGYRPGHPFCMRPDIPDTQHDSHPISSHSPPVACSHASPLTIHSLREGARGRRAPVAASPACSCDTGTPYGHHATAGGQRYTDLVSNLSTGALGGYRPGPYHRSWRHWRGTTTCHRVRVYGVPDAGQTVH